ncbi:MAG: hypothetical protein WCI18_12940 [Pseudomonadota bacterium]
MKKWTFPYKASYLTKSASYSGILKSGGIFTVFMAVAISCAMTQESAPAQKEPGIFVGLVDKIFGSRYSYQISLAGSEKTLLRVSDSVCKNPENKLEIALEVQWESLNFPLEITASLASASSPGIVDFKSPSAAYSLRDVPYFTKEKLESVCAQFKNKGTSIEVAPSEPFVQSITLALSALAPDCNISLGQSGFQCDSSKNSIAQLKSRAIASHQMVINEFQRLPYLMVRKASTLKQFALVQESEAGINGFCRILSNSIQEELPLAFRSNLWRKAVCSDRKEAGWKSVAADGMELAIKELDVLTSIANDTTKKGVLSVRVPTTHKTLWVQLTPSETVVQSFQSVILKNQSRQAAIGIKGACWHPIFDDKPELLQVSSAIGLFQRSNGGCEYKIENQDSQPWKYLANALNGETAFVVDNSKSKILQLPLGNYTYQVYPMPQDPRSERPESGPQISSGTLSWTAKSSKLTLQ